MKKLFIIGTGRNGSKLTAKIFSTVTSKHVFGERHHGLDPIFFKDAYMGKISKQESVRKFKQSRDSAMKNIQDIYIEKNHLIVPILNEVLLAYPDALFLHVTRDPKESVRSFFARNVYTGKNDIYEIARLSPRSESEKSKWDHFIRFEKACWYIFTMTKMCDSFLYKLPAFQYRIVSYNSFIEDPLLFKPVFDWVGLEFDEGKTKDVLSVQLGSSCRSPSEVSFEISRPDKFTNTPHWENWSDNQKKIFKRYFGRW